MGDSSDDGGPLSYRLGSDDDEVGGEDPYSSYGMTMGDLDPPADGRVAHDEHRGRLPIVPERDVEDGPEDAVPGSGIARGSASGIDATSITDRGGGGESFVGGHGPAAPPRSSTVRLRAGMAAEQPPARAHAVASRGYDRAIPVAGGEEDLGDPHGQWPLSHRARRSGHRRRQRRRSRRESSSSESSATQSDSSSASGSSGSSSGSDTSGSGSSGSTSGSSSSSSSSAPSERRSQGRTPRRRHRSRGRRRTDHTPAVRPRPAAAADQFASPPLPSTSYFAIPGGGSGATAAASTPFSAMVHGVPPPPPPSASLAPPEQSDEWSSERAALQARIASQDERIAQLEAGLAADRTAHRADIDRLVGSMEQQRAPKSPVMPASPAAQPSPVRADDAHRSSERELELQLQLQNSQLQLEEARRIEADLRSQLVPTAASGALAPTPSSHTRASLADNPESPRRRSEAADAELATQVEELNARLATQTMTCSGLEQQVQGLENKLATAEGKIEEHAAEIDSRDEKIARLLTKLADAEIAEKLHERRSRSDANNLQQFEHDLDAQRKKLSQEAIKVANASKEIEHLRMKCATLADDLTEAQKVAKDARLRADAATAEAERWRLQSRQFETELSGYRSAGGLVPTGSSPHPVSGTGTLLHSSPLSPGHKHPPMSPSEIRERDRRGDGIVDVMHGQAQDYASSRLRSVSPVRRTGAEGRGGRDSFAHEPKAQPLRQRDRSSRGHQDSTPLDPAHMTQEQMERKWKELVLAEERKKAAQSAADRAALSPAGGQHRGHVQHSLEHQFDMASSGSIRRDDHAAADREAERRRRMEEQRHGIDRYDGTPMSRATATPTVQDIMRAEAEQDAERRRLENETERHIRDNSDAFSYAGRGDDTPVHHYRVSEERPLPATQARHGEPASRPYAMVDDGMRDSNPHRKDARVTHEMHPPRPADDRADKVAALAKMRAAQDRARAREAAGRDAPPPRIGSHRAAEPEQRGRRRYQGHDTNTSSGFASAMSVSDSRPVRPPPVPVRSSAVQREAAAPFATEASREQDSRNVAQLESKLLRLNMERDDLISELGRLGPRAGRTIRERRRKTEIESRLEDVGKQVSAVRTTLRRIEPPM